MLLAIDIGNTNIHFGMHTGVDWCCSWRARTIQDKMSDEYAVLLRSFFEEHGFTFLDVDGVAIASVVPRLTETFVAMARRYLKSEPLVVSSEIPLGVRVTIDHPREAGADRLCNAAAAFRRYGGPAAVVDFGTSTNFDIVTAKGDYIGGIIAAGIRLTHDALVSRAAKLTSIDLEPPPSVIGQNTIHAMQSGLYLGYIAMIEGLVQRVKDELGSETKIIGTGGLAPTIEQTTNVLDVIELDLTLEGIRLIWELNRVS